MSLELILGDKKIKTGRIMKQARSCLYLGYFFDEAGCSAPFLLG